MIRRRSLSLGGALAALALSLSACASIPDSGDVGTIDVPENAEGAQSRVEVEGPSDGDTPDAIVRGFLEAGAAYSNNYSVARSYLTEGFSNEWDPNASVSILSSDSSLDSLTSEVSSDSQSVSLDIPVQAEVDGLGIYAEKATGTLAALEFTLRQVNGEWRISRAPDGIFVTSSTFQNLYEGYPLYFYSPGFDSLVPDLRWFLRSSSTGTQVMNALLRGPSDSLEGAITSAIPDGASLDPQAVTVSEGRASVSLDISGLDDDTAQNVYNQIRTTMLEIGSITSVQVSTRDASLTEASDAGTVVGVSGETVAISDGRLVSVAGNALRPIENGPDVKGGSQPALDYSGKMIAYLGERRKSIHLVEIGSSGSDVVIQGDSLVGPSFDRYGWLWTAEAGGSGIMGLSPSGELVTISLSYAADRSTTGVALSRDGSRIALMSTDKDGGGHIDVGGLIRESNGYPVSSTGKTPLSVGAQFSSFSDMTWAGNDELAVLAAEQGDSGVQPYALPVSGPAQSLGEVNGGRSIAASNDVKTVRVSSESGALYTYSSGAWQRVADANVTDPAYSG